MYEWRISQDFHGHRRVTFTLKSYDCGNILSNSQSHDEYFEKFIEISRLRKRENILGHANVNGRTEGRMNRTAKNITSAL